MASLSGPQRLMALALALVLIVGAIVAIELTISPAPPTVGTLEVAAPADSEGPGDSGEPGDSEETKAVAEGPRAPDLAGIVGWVNTQPFTLEELRGKVVLVDFWTYSCINCLRTLPHLRSWHEKYSPKGLVVLGVHSPEFDFEKIEDNVREAVVRERVTWPVALDNGFETWRAYRNRYWPRKYLIDADGIVRYDRIGEGGYIATENEIRKLLEETGADVSGIEVGGVVGEENSGVQLTRELYAGYGWAAGGYIGNKGGQRVDLGPGVATYTDPGDRENGKIYLNGTWRIDQERASPADPEVSDDFVIIQFKAADVFSVIRPEGTEPFQVDVTTDGRPIPEAHRGDDVQEDVDGRTYFTVDSPRLYTIVRADTILNQELRLSVESEDFNLYTFTFGG